jgi:hypothetical protein
MQSKQGAPNRLQEQETRPVDIHLGEFARISCEIIDATFEAIFRWVSAFSE